MKKALVFLGIIAFLLSCEPEEKYSFIPYIQFVSLEKIANDSGIDSKANLTFYFEDGDGDLGLDDIPEDLKPPFDASSIYHYNFFINYYEKQNGTFVKIDLPAEQNARISPLKQ